MYHISSIKSRTALRLVLVKDDDDDGDDVCMQFAIADPRFES